jgi:hypothetical protein
MRSTRRVPLTAPNPVIGGVKLNIVERYELTMLARKELTLGGKNFMAALEDTMSSSMYLTSTNDVKVDLLRAVQNDYDRAARDELEQRHQFGDLGRRIRERAAIEQRLQGYEQ